MGHYLLLVEIVLLASSIALGKEPNEIDTVNNPSKTSSDSRKDYYWKLWAKLIFGCIALVFACCKCCRQCQKSSDDEDDDDVIKNDKELRVYCDLCKEECLNPWHTHDFYCKAIKASTSIGSTYERLNIPLSDLKCPKCIHGYLGLRPPDVIPIDSRFKFICDLKEKVPENHVRLMNLVEGNEEKNQFTCMNCMCNLCLRCVRDMKLRNRPLKIVQWFHLGDESRLFDNFRRSEGGPFKDPAAILHPPPPPPPLRYGYPLDSGGHLYHSHHSAVNMDLPPYLPTDSGTYLTPAPPPSAAPGGGYSSNSGAGVSPSEGYANPVHQPKAAAPPPMEEQSIRSSNLILLSDLQRNRQQRLKGLNRSWSIMYPDSFPEDPAPINSSNHAAASSSHIPPTSHKRRGPLNRSLSVSTDFVAAKGSSSFDVDDDDIFNRHPKASKGYHGGGGVVNNKTPLISRSVSTKKIPQEDPTPLPTSLRPLPRRGTLNRSLTIIDEPPSSSSSSVKNKRGILNRSASMSTQQLAKASNALENERRAFEATFIKKMDEEEELEDLVGPLRHSSFGDLTSEDSRQTPNEEDYNNAKGSSGSNNGGIKRSNNRPKLRAQFSTDELDVRRVVCQSRNEKRYNGGGGSNGGPSGNNSSSSNLPGFSAINV